MARRRLLIVLLIGLAACIAGGAILYRAAHEEPDRIIAQHRICRRCAVRETVTEREWDVKKWETRSEEAVEATPTPLAARLGAAPGCPHSWLYTGFSQWDRGGGHGHGHSGNPIDTRTVGFVSESAAAIDALFQVAERRRVEPAGLWRLVADYCATRDESYVLPFGKLLEADGAPSAADLAGWLDRNLEMMRERVATWAPPQTSKMGR